MVRPASLLRTHEGTVIETSELLFLLTLTSVRGRWLQLNCGRIQHALHVYVLFPFLYLSRFYQSLRQSRNYRKFQFSVLLSSLLGFRFFLEKRFWPPLAAPHSTYSTLDTTARCNKPYNFLHSTSFSP